MFTFKTDKPTGRYRSFDCDVHNIKLNSKNVGTISDSKPHKISLMVMKTDTITDSNKNCDWKWITFKQPFDTIDAAKTFLKQNYTLITSKYQIAQNG